MQVISRIHYVVLRSGGLLNIAGQRWWCWVCYYLDATSQSYLLALAAVQSLVVAQREQALGSNQNGTAGRAYGGGGSGSTALQLVEVAAILVVQISGVVVIEY
jgi:hypothetical protein